ncbi:FG-GAP-like repeat-containing protein [Streptomyces sp. cg36]|uniref:FG-GAP-like repeat-containing protein n=1 Tax=Streptomyces sp. cg36 TaxID=3238798 RepID=UPI0034E301C8
MRRHMFVQGAVALVAAMGVTAAAVPATAAPRSSADDAAEVVLPADVRFMPRADQVREAGSTGYLHEQEGTQGTLWTDFATGRTRPSKNADATPYSHSGLRAKHLNPAGGPHQIVVTDLATDATTTLDLPPGYNWTGVYTSDSTVAYRLTGEVITAVSVFRFVDGKTVERPLDVVLPAGMRYMAVLKQDMRGAVVQFISADRRTKSLQLLQHGTGTLKPLPANFRTDTLVLAKDRILGSPYENREVDTFRRDDPAAEVVTARMASPTAEEMSAGWFGVVGDWIVYRRVLTKAAGGRLPGAALWAVPVTGGTPRQLLQYAAERLTTAPDGSILTTGGTGAKDWAIQRVTVDAEGQPQLATVREVPSVIAPVTGLALGAGTLSYFTSTGADPRTALYERRLGGSGVPVGEPVARTFDVEGAGLPQALGDGRTAYTSGSSVQSPDGPGRIRSINLPEPGRLTDANGRYTLSRGAGRTQYVGDFATGQDAGTLLGDLSAPAAVWGTEVWKQTGGPGMLGSIGTYDLKTKKVTPEFEADCEPDELQALGRWVYWSCGPESTGVYDRELKKSVKVPGGEVLLGDGFTVRRDHTTNKLMLTDFSKGAGTAPVTSEAGEPKPGQGDDRRASWTVDKFGGGIAYVDAEQRIHLRPVTVQRSPLAVVESRADTEIRLIHDGMPPDEWHGSWQLSRPAAAWTATVEDAKGRVVRAFRGDGGQRGALLSAVWDGKDDKGTMVPGGRYTWRLRIDAGDGTGLRELANGGIGVRSFTDRYRDFDGDGLGDLLGITPTGVADLRHGDGRGGVDTKKSATSWKSATAAVPFGDFDGDRLNDVLVRVSSGELRAYEMSPGVGMWSSLRYTRIGSGWNIYDALTSPGDLTGDGRADLLAREASTGDLYLYAANGARNFKPRVKIGNGWKGYTLTGTGDVNGDGKADLLARDTSGVLWLYPGTGKGTLGTRIKVGGGWQVYNALVGAGDLNGDGKPDLLARGTDGVLWSYAGDGKGNFAGRQRIGGGWQMYKYLF